MNLHESHISAGILGRATVPQAELTANTHSDEVPYLNGTNHYYVFDLSTSL